MGDAPAAAPPLARGYPGLGGANGARDGCGSTLQGVLPELSILTSVAITFLTAGQYKMSSQDLRMAPCGAAVGLTSGTDEWQWGYRCECMR